MNEQSKPEKDCRQKHNVKTPPRRWLKRPQQKNSDSRDWARLFDGVVLRNK